ncbi:MAG: hypothetical protein P4M08_11600 [Oligoflexia bacterium]|nr:hypothetical protein [Oligoflexia bacterium]
MIHEPANAEHELRKAYNCVIDAATTFFWDRKGIPGVNPDEVVTIYKRAFRAHRDGDRLAAERWARTAKHLSRAFQSEAKIAFLEPRTAELPCLEGATPEEYCLTERVDATEDLINSLADHIPHETHEISKVMEHYLRRARRHLETLHSADVTHELLRAEVTKAAHEYGRVLECMQLAYEAEQAHGKSAA